MKTRFLTLVSAGVVAAGVFAVPVAAQASAPASVVQAPRDRDDWETEDYYDSRRECDREGRRGERRDRWEDYDCERVVRGPHRGDWRLEVLRDDDDHDRFRDRDRPGRPDDDDRPDRPRA